MKWMSSPSISVMKFGRAFSLASHLAPVVLCRPILCQFLTCRELDALRCVGDGFALRPARCLYALAQVGQFRFRKTHHIKTHGSQCCRSCCPLLSWCFSLCRGYRQSRCHRACRAELETLAAADLRARRRMGIGCDFSFMEASPFEVNTSDSCHRSGDIRSSGSRSRGSFSSLSPEVRCCRPLDE